MANSDSGEWTLARRRIRRYLITSVIVVVFATVLGVVGYFLWRFRTIGTLITCVKTGQYQVGEILLRTTSELTDVLLVAPVTSRDVARSELDNADLKPSRPVYRFTPGVAGVVPCGLDEWVQATGAITYRYSARNTARHISGRCYYGHSKHQRNSIAHGGCLCVRRG